MLAGCAATSFSKDFDCENAVLRRSGEPSITLDHVDLVFAHQKIESLGVLGDDFVLARLDSRPVQLCAFDAFNAKLLSFLDVVIDFGVKEQRLGWNAAHVQAGAAKLVVLLNEGHFEPILAAADGGSVSARTAADDRYIVDCVWQFKLPCLCEDGQQMAKH